MEFFILVSWNKISGLKCRLFYQLDFALQEGRTELEKLKSYYGVPDDKEYKDNVIYHTGLQNVYELDILPCSLEEAICCSPLGIDGGPVKTRLVTSALLTHEQPPSAN